MRVAGLEDLRSMNRVLVHLYQQGYMLDFFMYELNTDPPKIHIYTELQYMTILNAITHLIRKD